MTTYKCRLGCVQGDPPRPVYHAGHWECPKDPAFDAGKATRARERRENARKALRGEPTGPQGSGSQQGAPGTPPAAPGAAPAITEKPSTGLKQVEFGQRVAETARREAQAQADNADWELPADSAETFFGTIRNWFHTFANFMDDILDAEHTKEGRIKAEVFELNSHDLAAARGGFGRRLATKVVKKLGAKTLQQGIETVDSLAFVTMFGMMFLTMVTHFWKVAEESPRLKKLRDAAKAQKEKKALAAAEKTAEAKRGAIDVNARPAGAPG